MKSVQLYARVRRAVLVEGRSERGVPREFGLARDTVRKMLRHSVPPGYRRQQPVRRPKLGPWLGVVDAILEADKSQPAKQRHTAKRIFRLGQRSTPPKVVRIPNCPKLAEDNIRKGFLEDGQYRKLVEYCPELWFRALVECGRTYGWRVSELLTMRVSQVDVAQRVIRLEPGTTKNRDGQEVLMTDAVCQLLTALVHGKSADDCVFTRKSGKPVRDFRVGWHNACAHAGVPDLLFHDLRRTGARNLRRAGVAEGIIMKIGGWRTRSVFERYAIVSRSDMNDAILKLQESEKRAEQERVAAEEQAAEARAQSGHNEALLEQPTASRAVN